MRWSKLKQRIEEGFANSVRGRVEIWTTRYRHAHDQEGEAWITIDGERLHSMGTMRFYNDEWEAIGRPDYSAGERPLRAWGEVEAELNAKGSMGLWSVNTALFNYLSLPIEEVLSSDVALVRGIGMLDRRLGKRRLIGIDTSNSPDFVQELHRFRCEAERVELRRPPLIAEAGRPI